MPHQGPPDGDQQDGDDEEAEVPGQGAAQVVPDVVDPEQLVIDEPFDDVEDAPAGEQQTGVRDRPGRFSHGNA